MGARSAAAPKRLAAACYGFAAAEQTIREPNSAGLFRPWQPVPCITRPMTTLKKMQQASDAKARQSYGPDLCRAGDRIHLPMQASTSTVGSLSLPQIKSARIDGAGHQGQAALRCAQRAE